MAGWGGGVSGSDLRVRPPCPGLPRGGCVMRGQDKESQRRGTDGGGEGRTEWKESLRRES